MMANLNQNDRVGVLARWDFAPALCVVWLGTIGCTGPTPEERAIAAFERLGGKVVRNDEGHAVQLYLSRMPVTDTEFANVVALEYLVHVEALSTALSDACIEHLCKLPKLRSADLSFSQVSAEGAQWLMTASTECRVTIAQSDYSRKSRAKR